MNHDKLIEFITALRESDTYIVPIFTEGSCFQFYLILKCLAPEAEPMINLRADHVVSNIGGRYYDIRGEITHPTELYRSLTGKELNEAKTWSFGETKFIQLGECPACEEPLLAIKPQTVLGSENDRARKI